MAKNLYNTFMELSNVSPMIKNENPVQIGVFDYVKIGSVYYPAVYAASLSEEYPLTPETLTLHIARAEALPKGVCSIPNKPKAASLKEYQRRTEQIHKAVSHPETIEQKTELLERPPKLSGKEKARYEKAEERKRHDQYLADKKAGRPVAEKYVPLSQYEVEKERIRAYLNADGYYDAPLPIDYGTEIEEPSDKGLALKVLILIGAIIGAIIGFAFAIQSVF
jgi:hypothetical protein